VRADLAVTVVLALRKRILADGSGEGTERANAAYREWRGARVERLCTDAAGGLSPRCRHGRPGTPYSLCRRAQRRAVRRVPRATPRRASASPARTFPVDRPTHRCTRDVPAPSYPCKKVVAQSVRSPTERPPASRRIGRLSRRSVWTWPSSCSGRFPSYATWRCCGPTRCGSLGGLFQRLFHPVLRKGGTRFHLRRHLLFIMWGNLLLTDRFGARDLSFDPEDEVVRRFQNVVTPLRQARLRGDRAGHGHHRRAQRDGPVAEVSPVLSRAAVSHKGPGLSQGPGFYVFTLPFVSFVVTWFPRHLDPGADRHDRFHFLNGGIRTTRVTPRVSPRVKAHLSVIGCGDRVDEGGWVSAGQVGAGELHQRLRPGRELHHIHARMRG